MFTCKGTRMHDATIHVTCALVGMRLYMSTGPVASLKLRLGYSRQPYPRGFNKDLPTVTFCSKRFLCFWNSCLHPFHGSSWNVRRLVLQCASEYKHKLATPIVADNYQCCCVGLAPSVVHLARDYVRLQSSAWQQDIRQERELSPRHYLCCYWRVT